MLTRAKSSTPVSSQSVTISPVSAEPASLTERRDRSGVLWRYFALTYVALLVNHLNFLADVDSSGALAWSFAAVVYVTGPLLHLLFTFAPVLVLNAALGRRTVDPPQPGRRRRDLVVYATAAVLFTAQQGVALLDGYVHNLYGFHLNGMVLNLVRLPAASTRWPRGCRPTGIRRVVLGIVAVQVGLLLAVLKLPRVRRSGRGRSSSGRSRSPRASSCRRRRGSPTRSRSSAPTGRSPPPPPRSRSTSPSRSPGPCVAGASRGQLGPRSDAAGTSQLGYP